MTVRFDLAPSCRIVTTGRSEGSWCISINKSALRGALRLAVKHWDEAESSWEMQVVTNSQQLLGGPTERSWENNARSLGAHDMQKKKKKSLSQQVLIDSWFNWLWKDTDWICRQEVPATLEIPWRYSCWLKTENTTRRILQRTLVFFLIH